MATLELKLITFYNLAGLKILFLVNPFEFSYVFINEQQTTTQMKKSGLILNYSKIDESKVSKKSMDRQSFKEHMEFLSSISERCFSLNDFGQKELKDIRSVFITFDGAYQSDLSIVAPILNELNLKATFFVPAQKLDSKSPVWQDYRDLIKDGHSIGSMGLRDESFARMNVKQQMYHLQKSKYILEEKLDEEIHYFALPKGKFNHHTIRLASEAQYKMLFSSRFGFINLASLPYLTNRWKIDGSVNVEMLQKVCNEDSFLVKSMKYKLTLQRIWHTYSRPLSYS